MNSSSIISRPIIDVNRQGMVAVCASGNVVSISRCEDDAPCAVCKLPDRIGVIKRLVWARCKALDCSAAAIHSLSADCDHGFALLDFVSARYVKLRVRHACALPSMPHTEWLYTGYGSPELAVMLDIPRVVLVWSPRAEAPSLFTLVRRWPEACRFDSQYYIHWKRPQAARSMLTLWPSLLSCELPVQEPNLMCYASSLLFAFSDALLGGLYVGAIHNPILACLPDVQPIALAWLKSGHILCLTGSTSTSRRRLVMYDETLNEAFSFSDAALAPETPIDQIMLDEHDLEHLELVRSRSEVRFPLFDDESVFFVDGGGEYVAVKSAKAVSMWKVTQGTIPELLQVSDYGYLPGFHVTWVEFNTPLLFVYCHRTPYMCISRPNTEQVTIKLDCTIDIVRSIVTETGEVVIITNRGYHRIFFDSLRTSCSTCLDNVDTPNQRKRLASPLCLDSSRSALQLDSSGIIPTPECTNLKRRYSVLGD